MEADGKCKWQQQEDHRLADDILSAKSLESDSKSEGEEPQVQEPIENIQQDQEIKAEIDAEKDRNEEQEFSEDSFDEQDL